MITLSDKLTVLKDGRLLGEEEARATGTDIAQAKKNTLPSRILRAHSKASDRDSLLHITFDGLASHDITFVGIIQTARASGLKEFPVPYALTNCHNSLCAVGGTINEDDHLFGLTAAQKYGGNYVPPNLAVIHQYVRETMAGCGRMILGSDSHTRYGALGTMGVGEGGPELVKQLLKRTYDIAEPETVLVWLENAPQPGVGPQDVAVALVGAVFKSGFVKNRVLEFAGPGIASLSVEYRMGIDVMTTETTCLPSLWETHDRAKAHLTQHGRAGDYKKLSHDAPAAFDRCIVIDLAKVPAMMALPFHPSNAYPVTEVIAHAKDIFGEIEDAAHKQFGRLADSFRLRDKIHADGIHVDQGLIAGCAGGSFENLTLAAAILDGKSIGNTPFSLSVYPASEPQAIALVRNGSYVKLMEAGALIKNAFCGPCFGAGDTPAHGALSIRHSTRNFPNREGSKPGNGQVAGVALMDARSIAATAANAGRLTPATDLDWDKINPDLTYHFDANIYRERCYQGWGRADSSVELKYGPNITDWPAMAALPENLLLRVACVITDPVTTTDELIPSGETSSLRSNPLKLAEFALSRKDPEYVGRAKDVFAFEKKREADPADASVLQAVRKALAPLEKSDRALFDAICGGKDLAGTGIGSTIFAMKPGDGSAREQAASSQKVLGGWANLALEYATKRYRSNLINWGMLPFLCEPGIEKTIANGDFILVPGIRSAVKEKKEVIPALFIHDGSVSALSLKLGDLTDDERRIILDGCLINFYNEK